MGNINSSLLQQTKQLAENQEARVQHSTEAQLTEGWEATKELEEHTQTYQPRS